MSTSTELDTLALKVQQAYYADGLADLFMGFILLGLAALFTLLAYNITFLLWLFIITLNPLIYGNLIERAKQVWVYPRAGYVKPKSYEETSTRGALLVLAVIGFLLLLTAIVLFILSGYAGLFLWLIWLAPTGFGLMVAIGPLIIARKHHLTRYYLFALLPPLVGVIIPWLHLSFPTPYAAFFTTVAIQTAIIGLLALCSGTFLFLRFLHRYPVEPIAPVEGENPHALL